MPKRKMPKKKSRRWPKGKLLVGACLAALIFVTYGAWQYSTQLPPTIGGETNNPVPTGSAPNFSLKDINGTQFSLEQFSGKVIAIHFMAVGCSGQINSINEYQLKQLKNVCNIHCSDKPVTMVTVAVATCPSIELTKIRTNYGVTWVLGNDYDNEKLDIVNAYKSYSILDGTILLIDKAFNVDKVYTDATTAETLSSRINQLLGV